MVAPLVDAGSDGVYQYIICIIIGLLGIPLWYVRVKNPAIGRKLFGWLPFYEDAKILKLRSNRTPNMDPDTDSSSFEHNVSNNDSGVLDEKVLEEDQHHYPTK